MRSPAVAVLFLGVAAAGCASKADVEVMGESLRTDIEEVRDGQRILLAQLEGGLDSLEAAGMRRESVGRGEFERRLSQLEDRFEQVLEIVTQNHQLLADLYEDRRPAAGGPVRGAGPPAGGTFGSDEPSHFYAMALDMYNRGNLATARDAFESFLAENAQHELAPDAQYYIARTYEDEGDEGNALAEYQRVTELFPDSNRAPAALFRRGLIAAEGGNTALARRLFAQIETGYPNSPEAPSAREELRKLSG